METTNGNEHAKRAAGVGPGDGCDAIADAERARRRAARDLAEAQEALRRAQREAEIALILALIAFVLALAWWIA